MDTRSQEMADYALLTLIAPIGLEEVIVDWLFDNAPDQGFCSGPVNGHSASHDALSLSEQVSGRKRQIRFEIHAEEEAVRGMIERLGREFPGAGLHYWVTPLSGAGPI